MRMGRRGFLTGIAAAGLLQTRPLLAAPGGPRLVSLDWGVSEMLYAMRLPVAGAADTIGYRRVVEVPATPPATVNVGLWSAPNIELLAALKPDLMLLQSWQRGLLPQLQRVGPTEVLTFYTRQGSVYDQAVAAARAIAERVGEVAAGEAMLGEGEALLARCRAALRDHRGTPLIVVMIIDGRGIIAFSRASLFHDVLERLGLVNCWDGEPRLLCGASLIDLTTLAASRAARIIIIDPPGPSPDRQFFESRLWSSLPFVAAGRVSHLPSLWEFGALPTGWRFAERLTAALVGTR